MNARKVDISLRNLRRALDRLGEALEVPESNAYPRHRRNHPAF